MITKRKYSILPGNIHYITEDYAGNPDYTISEGTPVLVLDIDQNFILVKDCTDTEMSVPAEYLSDKPITVMPTVREVQRMNRKWNLCFGFFLFDCLSFAVSFITFFCLIFAEDAPSFLVIFLAICASISAIFLYVWAWLSIKFQIPKWCKEDKLQELKFVQITKQMQEYKGEIK